MSRIEGEKLEKFTLASKIVADTVLPTNSMEKRIDGYPQRIRADVRVIRTLAGLGVFHPSIIYLLAQNGIQSWEEALFIGLNLVPYTTAARYVESPRRIKQLIPNHIRRRQGQST